MSLSKFRRDEADQEFAPGDPGPRRGLFFTKVALWCAGSLGGRTLEIQVGLSRSRDLGEDTSPSHRQSRSYAQSPALADRARPLLGSGPGGDAHPAIPSSVSAHEGIVVAGNFWDCLTADQKRLFRAKAHNRVFAAGARLMREGDEGDNVAVILSGLTEIRAGDDDGERVIAERGPGQLIGERAALEVNVRSATVVALQTVVALVMRTADFAAFISTYPAVLKIVEEQIYLRLQERPPTETGAAGNLVIGATAPRPLALTGQNCTVVRTDVVGFGAEERGPDAHKIIRRESLAMIRLALGTAWDTCRREDRGDGELIIVPPDIPTTQVIERLVSVLPVELRRHNRIYGMPSQLRLRVAVEVGPIEDDESGMVGRSIVSVARILDADPFKQAMASRGALLGIAVSPFVYETHILAGGSILDPADYTEVPVHVKETRKSAWVQLIS